MLNDPNYTFDTPLSNAIFEYCEILKIMEWSQNRKTEYSATRIVVFLQICVFSFFLWGVNSQE